MPIDLSQVDWLYVVLLAVFVFVASLVGGALSFGHRWTATTLSTLLFVVLFVFWTYYPHRVPGPRAITLPDAATTTAVPVPAAPPAPAASQKPRNPVTDITPRNPVTDVTPPAPPATPLATPVTPPAAPAPAPAAPAARPPGQ
jgi:hypothetical protein